VIHLAAILAPLFKAFWSAYFEAYQNAQFTHVEKMTDEDKAELEKFKRKLRDDGVAGPDDWMPGTKSITGLHETTSDR
jgi:hypothetical protein